MDAITLQQIKTTPSPGLIAMMKNLTGDIIVLGAGGKMGPDLCLLAARAVAESGVARRLIAVSRYSNPAVPETLRKAGVEVVSADLMDETALANLPDAANVLYMVGRKFGTTGSEQDTWAMNVYLPGRVAERYKNSRIVVFSSGNIYPYMPIASGGAVETTHLVPNGEYAITCLGRERIFDFFSRKNGTPIAFYRLNYAVDMRYGVLYDIAQAVWENQPVSVNMGCFNCIWQGDANDWALRLLAHCTTPGQAYNVTGPERVSIRETALLFGQWLDRRVEFIGQEGELALLSNASATHAMFGYPSVPVRQVMQWTADWVRAGGESLGKPTHFETTDGKY